MLVAITGSKPAAIDTRFGTDCWFGMCRGKFGQPLTEPGAQRRRTPRFRFTKGSGASYEVRSDKGSSLSTAG